MTGWGAVTYTGEARAGDTVVVIGGGGIGINAVQGAAAAGAEYVVAVDPVAFKREKALKLGATHAVATREEAVAIVTELTRGRMAQVCVNTMGIGEGDQIATSLALVGKRGRAVVTNLHRSGQLKLEELRTQTYALEDINPGYDDMRNGRNLRGVITF